MADEVARVLALPSGQRPFRTVIDLTDSGVPQVNDVVAQAREAFVKRMGFGDLLHVHTTT